VLPHSLIKLGSGLIILCLINCALQASAADEGARSAVRPYSYGAYVPGNSRSAIVEPGLQAIGAPVLNTIAPESTNVLPAIVNAQRRGAIDQMLQSHELRFGTSRSRALGLKDTPNPAGGVDLDAIRVRISRNKVLIRAQFTFN
jgi:hypothetical protein